MLLHKAVYLIFEGGANAHNFLSAEKNYSVYELYYVSERREKSS